MTIFAYLSEQCLSDAKTHTVLNDVERLRSDIEERQSLSIFDQFPPPYLVKKKLHGRQKRLVAETRRIGDHTVVVFLAVMIRSSRDYEEEFSRNPVLYGEKHFKGLVTDEALESFVEARTAEDIQPGKPAASAAEYELLYNAFSHARTLSPSSGADNDELDRIVCETSTWVHQSTQPHIQNQLNRLAECCQKALSLKPGLSFIPASEKKGWGVWAYRYEGYVLLTNIVDTTNDEEVRIESERIAAEIGNRGVEALLQSSRRAYPAGILTDEQLWLDLEREKLANMALSPEETEVLESARVSDRPFPLFINGRAGSGKSTILQYLFADILQSYTRIVRLAPDGGTTSADEPVTPLYLTANGELLRVARHFVERLVRSQYRFLQDEGEPPPVDEQTLTNLLDRAFREFRPFMLELVDPKDRLRFTSSQRVDFPRFRRLWEARFGKDPKARRDHGPDVSWHVIRSYIKGLGSEDYLTPEDYAQLPENQLTVSLQTFSTVHDQVWTNWYQSLNEDGQWDDQDLARYILDNDRAPRCHCAVFCDEAQDFTRIELEVLLRLSLYSNRNLTPNDVNRVPFAFAGDEFQTLNPTGFRWDAVKASFVEKFIFELDPSRRGEKAELNYRELRFNYRSAEPIVKMANLVQALRAASFEISELRPQKPWLHESSHAPVLHFRADDAAFWTAFREQSAGFVVIVPCNEGEEAEFVAQDPILSQHIEQVDGLPRNVLSAGRAKGCEYEAVVVYGFGAATDTDLISTIGAQGRVPQDTRQSLTLQYFINRLYVAVSRSKRRLVVVDSDEGVGRLWKAARDEFARERLINALKRGAEVWGPYVGGSSPGKPSDLASDSVPDRVENARAFYSDGQARRDSYLMRQAAGLYREAQDTARWKECRARAFDFDEKWMEAGAAYAEAGFLDEARRCLWRSERPGWLKLMELSSEHPELLSHIELQWARAILEKPNAKAASTVLGRLCDRITHDPVFALASCSDTSWQHALDALLRQLMQSEDAVPPAAAKGMLHSLDELVRQGLSVPDDLLAELAFRGEDFERAARHWESVGERRSPRYLLAKASSAPYPHCIEYLHRLGDSRGVATAYDAFKSTSLDPAQSNLVIAALLAEKRSGEALELANQYSNGTGALEIALHARGSGDEELAIRALLAGFRHHVTAGSWDVIVEFVTRGGVAPDNQAWRDKNIRAWLKGAAPLVRIELIRALARSDKLPDASPNVEQAVSRFLREQLRVKGGTWKSSLTYLEAGAALERTLRIVDALQFYEAALEERLSGEVLHSIRMRWLAVKGRQLEYERGRPKSDASTIKRIENEIQSSISAWQISRQAVQQLPRFPALDELLASPLSSAVPPGNTAPNWMPTAAERPPIALGPVAQAVRSSTVKTEPGDTTTLGYKWPAPPSLAVPNANPIHSDSDLAAEAEDVGMLLGPLRVDVRRAAQVCLVSHTESLDTVKLDWGKRRVSGTLDPIEESGMWRVPDWGLQVELPLDGDTLARLTLGPSRIQILIVS